LSVSFVEDPRDKFHDTTEPTRKDQHATTMSFANNNHHRSDPPPEPAFPEINSNGTALVFPLSQDASIPDEFKRFPSSIIRDNKGNTWKTIMVPPDVSSRYFQRQEAMEFEILKMQTELTAMRQDMTAMSTKIKESERKTRALIKLETAPLKTMISSLQSLNKEQEHRINKSALVSKIVSTHLNESFDIERKARLMKEVRAGGAAFDGLLCYVCRKVGENEVEYASCGHRFCGPCAELCSVAKQDTCECGEEIEKCRDILQK
jgi:hypothetical protein